MTAHDPNLPTHPDPDDLDAWFASAPPMPTAAAERIAGRRKLGVIVGGSLNRGLEVKLDRDTDMEALAVGSYVVVQGRHKDFFCMITDIMLETANPAIRSDPPDISDPFLAEVYGGTAAYGVLHVAPVLVIDRQEGAPRPIKTVPAHFTAVQTATAEDVNRIFGEEDAEHFNIGAPLELEHTQVNLDLRRLVERSVGVFGKSGTGKSFLTRMVLAGIIKNNVAVNLIFDMHNDYGWSARDERGTQVKGLRQLFGAGKVAIFTLDAEATRRRGVSPDYEVVIPYSAIEPEDLAMLKTTLDLSDSMIDAAYELSRHWGKGWIGELIHADAETLKELKEEIAASPASVQALKRRVQRFQRYAFLTEQAETDSAKRILEHIERGVHVVLEFGRYGSDLSAYILVANYLTRRIHSMYVERMEKALGDSALEPPQLLITIEEAHKFLDPQIARQTIFGIIARELRKYNVTLLVVDQRPSGIDEEVMSQIGTRITALLDNERDIAAVLTGVSGASGLREVLARLDTKQQALILGHAVPMPVVVQTRTYDTDFYRALGVQDEPETPTRSKPSDPRSRRLR